MGNLTQRASNQTKFYILKVFVKFYLPFVVPSMVQNKYAINILKFNYGKL